MASPSRRRDLDLMKLMMSDYDVEIDDSSAYDFTVMFDGPKDTPYAGGKWKVHVELPVSYPFKSPSIGFKNRIFHPNVDERSGSVCLDVINQTWSPMFDLINIFDMFLPQLLRYPNADDPLNGEAAALMLREPAKYATRVKEHTLKYASEAAAKLPEVSAGCRYESSSDPKRKESDASGDTAMDEDEEDDDENCSVVSDLSELSDD